ncbi:hypothetical protein [Geitlerinema sp. PCC 7407]|uniref:hypothetical protein n=1 Tax=Geitlerinema sp. PCC 7407 TaxID=1173025 RepID=UPI00029FB944|nr:hypothetical protein [Geitlerinema sp. PCC 7407]AFY66245.1 hypothetical protein GEI7407_1758 [Geitlerinema sp. PCC 7407]
MPSLAEWYIVRFDESRIALQVNPPHGNPWSDEIPWQHIIRICFKTGDWFESDEVYIFTNQRPESYVIPTEANGGQELWFEILKRNLFDAELAVEAAKTIGQLFCFPM